jgi:hypothetical protein
MHGMASAFGILDMGDFFWGLKPEFLEQYSGLDDARAVLLHSFK